MDIQHTVSPLAITRNQQWGEVENRSQQNGTRAESTSSSEETKPVQKVVTGAVSRLTEKLMSEVEQPDRVAAIKAQIAEGSFEINPEKIADKLLWGERIAVMSER